MKGIAKAMSDVSQGPGWWLASDGRWYPPSTAPPYAGDPYQGTAYSQLPPKTNALAVISLVLSIIWVAGLGAVLAVIFGFVARSQISKSNGRQKGLGVATAGIVVGFVGVAGAIVLIIGVVLVSSSGQSASVNPATSWCQTSCVEQAVQNTSAVQGTTVQCSPEQDMVSGELYSCIPTLPDGTQDESVPVIVPTSGNTINIDGHEVNVGG